MPHILLLDTVTDICSVALAKNDNILAVRSTENFRDHGKVITVFIEECVQEAGLTMTDIDVVAVSSGPGSFTSLRIGYSTAKGICMGLGIPLITIDTLTSLAKAAIKAEDAANTNYVPMLDARSMGVYFAVFDKNLNVVRKLDRQKIDETSLLDYHHNAPLVLCGNAANKYEDLIEQPNVLSGEPIRNSATFLAALAMEAWNKKSFADIAYAAPNYVAPPNITTPKKKISLR